TLPASEPGEALSRWGVSAQPGWPLHVIRTVEGVIVREGTDDRLVNRLARKNVHEHALSSARFSPDGALLAGIVVVGGRGVLRIWDIETGTELATPSRVGTIPNSGYFRWSRDGRSLITIGPSALSLARDPVPWSGDGVEGSQRLREFAYRNTH